MQPGTGITPLDLMGCLRRRCAQTGNEHAAPHGLRRAFVSSALAAGADFARVQRLAGHRSSATTEGDERRSENAPCEAAALVYVPLLRLGAVMPQCHGYRQRHQTKQSTRDFRREDSTSAGSHTRSTKP